MKFAFLFLTYDNFINSEKIKEFTKNQNIYIHPKYPEKVDKYFKKYIIKDLIATEWGTMSIVNATLNLLKDAYLNEDNDWFILLSQDSYPIYSYENFIKKFNKINNNKSFFNFINHEKYWKTEQWWILNRRDVNIILHSKFKIETKLNGGIDEYYFLSLLKFNNPKYEFNNMQIIYNKWLKYTIQKSPLYFNKLLKNDIDNIKKFNSFFIRKVTSNFSLTEYKTKKKIYIIYIGSETEQNTIIFSSSFDIIIITTLKLDLIKKEIIDRGIYIINIIWKFFYETILNICNESYLLNWDIVIFTTEKFNLNTYNKIDKVKLSLPYNNFCFKNEKKIENIKKFYYIKDNNNNLAFCFKNK